MPRTKTPAGATGRAFRIGRVKGYIRAPPYFTINDLANQLRKMLNHISCAGVV
jgi:hypothetical protein